MDSEPLSNGLPRAISGHTIFEVSTHNRTPTSLFAIAMTKKRNFVTILNVASRPPLA